MSVVIQLRALRRSDEDAVYDLLSDDRVLAHMLFPTFTRERARAFTEHFSTTDPTGSPPQVVFAIAANERPDVIGLCGLVLDAGQRQGEAWYLLRPDLWGRGVITAATRELVSHGFDVLHLHRIWARCAVENPASARVLEKLGFQHEGFHRQNLYIRDAWHDSHTYALLASDRDRGAGSAMHGDAPSHRPRPPLD